MFSLEDVVGIETVNSEGFDFGDSPSDLRGVDEFDGDGVERDMAHAIYET